jgi:hypothetical protein
VETVYVVDEIIPGRFFTLIQGIQHAYYIAAPPLGYYLNQNIPQGIHLLRESLAFRLELSRRIFTEVLFPYEKLMEDGTKSKRCLSLFIAVIFEKEITNSSPRLNP